MTKNTFVCDCDVIHQDAVDQALAKIPTMQALNELTTFYKILSDPTRAKICFALDRQELCVCDLANVLSMSKSSISHQLRTLREHHIVKCRTAGKEVYYMLDDDHVQQGFELGFEHINHQKEQYHD